MSDSDLDVKADDTVVMPVIAEELQAGVCQVPTGGVRVHKHVMGREEIIDQPLRNEHEVRRVVRNEVVPVTEGSSEDRDAVGAYGRTVCGVGDVESGRADVERIDTGLRLRSWGQAEDAACTED